MKEIIWGRKEMKTQEEVIQGLVKMKQVDRMLQMNKTMYLRRRDFKVIY